MVNGKAVESKSTFRYECGIRSIIHAPAGRVWEILSDPAGYAAWNSTILSFEGKMDINEVIHVKSVLDDKRTFRMRITSFEPLKTMTWSDGMAPFFRGDRIYTITALADGTTEFSFVEILKGLLLPMVSGAFPDFPSIFETVAADLKRAAEASGEF